MLDEPREWTHCCNNECRNRAMISKSFDKNPPQSYCVECYDLEGRNAALKWNHDNGLLTLQQRKDYLSKGFKLKKISDV
jgi:hypothetical protein